ncbi:hypothetical protein E0E50_15220 [Azotobacter chroococcum subsp. isscasi]|uniref:hypothetical protein n=1 Tax=Azotobacter chroococcum TaxID=353 RepID=UPI00103A089F|nr:hypothetical protein [Azotobacter chroococcum]TBW08308.1 hypothetical protein E0E50_15220 [Azotobacter chroococcum subsp. isscasi]
MTNKLNEAKLAQLSAFVLERRAAVIRAGGVDPAVDEVAKVVESHFGGDLEAATQSLLEELTKRVQAAKAASRAAHERLQQAWNSPAINEMRARRDALLAEADMFKRRAEVAESKHKAKIATLKSQGFSDSEIAGVLGLNEAADEGLEQRHANLLAEAAAVRTAMEQHVAAVLAEGLVA